MTSSSEDQGCEAADWVWLRLRKELNFATSAATSRSRIGLALVGLGRIGQLHLRNILGQPQARLLYCVDADRGRLAACARGLHLDELGVRALEPKDYDVVLADERVGAVIVATPTPSHPELVRRALEARKSVMCEKPLADETSLVRPLYELAKRQKVFLMCALNRRWDPHYLSARRVVAGESQSCRLGELNLIRVTARDHEPPSMAYLSVSGGLLRDSVVHDINLSLWLARQLPDSIQVAGKSWREYFAREPARLEQLSQADRALVDTIDDFYFVTLTMHFPGGTIAIIDNGRSASYGFDQRLELFGTEGSLRFEPRPALNGLACSSAGLRERTLHTTFESHYKASYENELDDLIERVRLVQEGLHDSQDAIETRLIEPSRPCLVEATHRIASEATEIAGPECACTQLVWDEEFRREFEREAAN